MTNPTTLSPGWYADPAGSALRRWWDGARWTDHLLDPTTGQSPGAATTAPAGTSPNTGFMWSLALLGLVEVVAFALFDWEGYLRSSMSVSAASNPLSQFTPEYLLLMSVELLCWLAGVGLALGDWLALRRRGVPKPFHFAWVFLQSPWVYVIGRSVIVRRRVGFGMAPMWIFLLVQALMLVVVFAGMIPAMMSLFATLPYYSY